MNPRLYLTRKATEERRRCLAWIMERRCARRAPSIQPGASYSLSESPPRQGIACYALAILRDTPAFVAQQWANGNLPATIAQTGIAASIGFCLGCMFGLAV